MSLVTSSVDGSTTNPTYTDRPLTCTQDDALYRSSRTPANTLSTSIKSDNTASTACCSYALGSDMSIESNFSLENEFALNNNSNLQLNQRDRQRVCFDRIVVREYPLRLGDHPDCSSGPPITIGWDHVREKSCSVDEYEAERTPRKFLSQLKLSYFERKKRLRNVACTDKEIRQAITEVQRVQKEREQSKKVPLFGGLKGVLKRFRFGGRSSSQSS